MMWPTTNYDGQKYQILPPQHLRQMFAGTARPWIKSVRARFSGSAAFKELEKLRTYHPHLFCRLQYWLLFECWCAKQFEQLHNQIGGHPYNKSWSSHIEKPLSDFRIFVEDLKKVRKQLELFAKTHKPYPQFLLGRALERALEPEAATKVTMDDFLKLLEELENQYRIPLTLPTPRGWLGCLAYNKRVGGPNPRQHEARTALEFALSLRFRHFTNAAGRHPLDITGCTMPPDGKPCHRLVASFCKATFGDKIYKTGSESEKTPAGQITNTLAVLRHTYPRIKYVGWPVQV